MEIEDVPPTMLKPAPETVAWEIMIAAVPELVRVNVCELLEPAATLPKLMVVALAASAPEDVFVELDFAAGVPALVKPTQPETVSVTIRATIRRSCAAGVCPFDTTGRCA